MPPEGGPQVLRRLRHAAGVTERPAAQDRLAGVGEPPAGFRLTLPGHLQPSRAPGDSQ